MQTTTAIDFLDPAFLEDPYPAYRRLRQESPVAYLEDDEMWVVSRYDDVVSVLRDPGTFSSRLGMGQLMAGRISPRFPGWDTDESFIVDGGFRLLIAADPPDHTTLRRLVSGPFSPRAITRSMAERVRAIAVEVVDDLLEAGDEADIVRDIAYPLPVLVIADVLGIPGERREQFKAWSDAMVGSLSGGGLRDAEQQTAAFEMMSYFKEVIHERRADPGEDFISLLVASELRDGSRLTSGELMFLCVLLLIAGNETTTNLIGNGTWALANHPDEARRLREDPELLPSAVEEALRYDGPVQALFRETTTDVEMGGVRIPAGSRIVPLFGSANRDEEKFPDGERFVVSRNAADHVALGNGIHFCLGAALARLEARIVGEELLSRTRSIELRDTPTRMSTFLLRGFRSLPVAVRPA